MRAIKVGLIGWGTVGCGVIQVLRENAELIESRLGFPLELSRVADIDLERPRPVTVPAELLTTRADDILEDPEIDIVIELVGGLGFAKTVIMKALENRKHVVTANKALLAHAGNEIFAEAGRLGCSVGFEASVAGGIPLIKSLREGLAANRLDTFLGILNGTANYILTRMSEASIPFEEALREAQAHGYAEADPTLDIEGIDTAHKLAIACAIAFGGDIRFDSVYTEGITRIDPLDIQFCREFGYQLKLLAIGRRSDGELEMRVHPTLIPSDHVLASVRGAYNAIHIEGNAVGNIMLYGLGAGMMPTGSAVVSDLIDLARDIHLKTVGRIPPLSFVSGKPEPLSIKPMTEVKTCCYFRFAVVDSPGVLSRISGILGEHDISISAVIQKGRRLERAVPIVMLTHEALESNVRRALAEIDQLDIVRGKTKYIRIEDSGANSAA